MHETLAPQTLSYVDHLASAAQATETQVHQVAQTGSLRPRAASQSTLRSPLVSLPTAPPRLPPECVRAALDEVDTGVVLCTPQCRAMFVNEAARRVIDNSELLQLQADDRLVIEGAANQKLLQRAVQQAACLGLWQLAPLRGSSQTLMLAVQPLVGASATQPMAMLLFGREKLAPDLAVEMLANLHGLTTAERRVLKGLLMGHRVSELAHQHQVAVSTVRTQVAALRAKVGVARVDDLLRLVAEMPPISSALRGLRDSRLRGEMRITQGPCN